ncbi:hypothetical protein QJS66_10305 [Kocuria rhizophila]|nr:hypothetical protein QJS66_10305 [Kocuria rhizophila]
MHRGRPPVLRWLPVDAPLATRHDDAALLDPAAAPRPVRHAPRAWPWTGGNGADSTVRRTGV